MTENHDTETRKVRSADPGLSDEANRLLTDEMQEIVGSDTVEVAPGTPDHTHNRHGRHSPTRAAFENVRIELVITGFVLAIAIGVAAVATGSVIFLIGLVLLLFVGTAAVVKTTLGMTAQAEHADPRTAAELEEEGVDDPDAVLSDLVEGMNTRTFDHEDR